MSKLLLCSLSRTSSLLRPVLKSDIQALTQRLSGFQITRSLQEGSLLTEEEQVRLEQRRNAFLYEKKLGLRSRCPWQKDEDELLLKLYDSLGPQWSRMSKHFVNRPPGHCQNRYMLLTKGYERGPWTKEEVERLKEACHNLPADSSQIDWKAVQSALPAQRPLYLIKQKYRGACDPKLKMGRWSEEESERLRSLVAKYGVDNMETISKLMGNRSRRQCNERWRWQMADMKKGHYTEEEDKAILEAVKKYGENFAVVARVIKSQRTPRHISQHYRNLLAPGIDRKPWTLEEEELVYKVFLESEGDMVKTRNTLGSRRSVRDMWNHVEKMKRRAIKNESIKLESGYGEGGSKIKQEAVDQFENKA